MTGLKLSHVSYIYPGSRERAVDDVSLEWHAGEQIVLAGQSGSGKSTLVRLMKGLIVPDSGTIELNLDGSFVVASSDRLISTVGWCDAQPERQIFSATVAGEVGFALVNRGVAGRELKDSVNLAMLRVGLDPQSFLERDPLTLSGGEKRRVALASTIVARTPFVIFDEPEAGLDDAGSQMVSDLACGLKADGIGVMVISHDPGSMWRDTDRLIMMERGSICGDYRKGEIDWKALNDWLEK